MASPKLRKPPFEQFAQMVMRLPEAERVQMWRWVYGGRPNVRGLDLWVHLHTRLRELKASEEAAPMNPAPVSEG